MKSTAHRILLIEDDERLRALLASTLETAGYRVAVATNGEEGVRIAREFDPAVIVCDIQLPRGDGRSVLAALRGDRRLGGVQFVFMTGDSLTTPPREGMNLGADDFLEKPFTPSALLACVAARAARAEMLRRADQRALSRLSATVTKELPHELFTPLTGIIGLAEVLLEENDSADAKVRREMLEGIRASGERLNRTLRNYLSILELISGEDPTREEALRLDPDLLRLTVEDAAKAVAERNRRPADLTVTGEGFAAPIDRSNLASIVTELVDNACKFSEPGTPIIVRLTPEETGGRLDVCDRGRGLSPDQISQIGAFRQFDRNKYEQQGLGLGLTLVQHLAEREGGTVTLTSTPGEGTVASVRWAGGAG